MRRAFVVGFAVACCWAAGWASRAQAQERTIQGRAVTGINHLLGAPWFDFGPPFGAIGFATMGAYQSGGADALPLSPSSPPDTLLASTVDPLFLVVFGVPPDSFDPALLNVPLRDVGVITSPAGVRSALGDLLASPQLATGRSPSSGPLTLGKWMQARGTARIRCDGRSAPRIDLSFTGLVPRGLYSVWGGMLPPTGPTPVALGGVPNLFLAGGDGRASYAALLNYCPLALRPGEVPLAFIDVVLHSDHAAYGGVPEPFAGGLPPGLVTQIHVEFAVSARPIR
jgi:hypothetical protein